MLLSLGASTRLCLALLGAICAITQASGETTSADHFGVTIERVDDEFDADVVLRTPFVHDVEGSSIGIFRLVAYVNRKTSAVKVVLIWNDEYNREEWKFWSRAQASGALGLPVLTDNRKVLRCSDGRCDYREGVVFEVPKPLLIRLANDSQPIKLDSRDGPSRVITLAQHHWRALDAAIKSDPVSRKVKRK
jgi:hypothetical protein